MPSNLSREFPELEFGGYLANCALTSFTVRTRSLVQPEWTVLDVGCGRGHWSEVPPLLRANLRRLKGHCQKVIGIDVDPVGDTNPEIDEFRPITSARWPVEDAEVDMVTSWSVLEHVEHVDVYFDELQRVLKPGGVACLITPNLWSYFGVASHLVPNRWHAKMLQKLGGKREARDVFPTLYRANSVWRLRSLMRSRGLNGVVLATPTAVDYLRFSRVMMKVGKLYEKLAPSCFQPVLQVFLRKPR